MDITVIIVTWNSMGTIRNCIDSVYMQEDIYKVEVIVVDNASKDETLQEVSKNADIQVIRNESNLGFCAANNIGVKISRGEYILFLNPDVVLCEGYFRELIYEMENNPRIALITGKILLMHADGYPALMDGKNIIDSVGINLNRNRQAVDIGSGEADSLQYENACEVFGVSGAVCLCRKKALQDVMVDGQVFDESFFAYKEDVDLSWRLKKTDWICYYTPNAKAYHARTWNPLLEKRDDVSPSRRYHSFKNRRLMILKNENLRHFLPDILPILCFEILAFGYAIFREPYLLKAYYFILKSLPNIIIWRRQIHHR